MCTDSRRERRNEPGYQDGLRYYSVMCLPLCELYDDCELVYEEVVCRVDDDGDVVEMSLVGEVLVVVVLLVLTKRTRQSRAGCLDKKKIEESGIS